MCFYSYVMILIRGALGAGVGLLVWYFVWFINPLGILGDFPYHYEDGAFVIDHFFGLTGMVISFFVLPGLGAFFAIDN